MTCELLHSTGRRAAPVFFALLLLAGTAAGTLAQQAPALGPAHFLSGDTEILPAPATQSVPAISRGDGMYLVAWTDERSDPYATAPGADMESLSDVFAIRLGMDGTPVDPASFAVSMQGGNEGGGGINSARFPRLAWNDAAQAWLVAFAADVPTAAYYTWGIRAVRVGADGAVLDRRPLALPEAPDAGNASSHDLLGVASDGQNWVILRYQYVDFATGYELRAYRIAADGTLLDPDGVLVATNPKPFEGDIAWSGGVYLVTWSTWSAYAGTGINSSVRARRLAADLQPLDASPVVVADTAETEVDPVVEGNGSDFLVSYLRGGRLYVARVDAGGTVVDPAGIEVADPPFSSASNRGRLAWDGSLWFVGWGREGTTTITEADVARVTPGGSVLDPGGVRFPDFGMGQMAPRPGGGIRLTWGDERFGAGSARPRDVVVAAIDGNLSPGAGPEVVSLSARSQLFPDIAGTGSRFLVAFEGRESSLHRLGLSFVNEQGEPLTVEPLAVDPGSNGGPVRVAWNGSLFFAAWYDANLGGIAGSRIASDGTLLDDPPLLVMPDGFSPDVAALGDIFLVTGRRQVNSSQFVHPFAVRVRAGDGQVLDQPLMLGQYYARNLSVEAVGGHFLATWARHFSHDDNQAELNAAFIEPDGSVSGEFTLDSRGYQPRTAWSGSRALVAYRRGSAATNNRDIWGILLREDGSVDVPPFPISEAPEVQELPAVAWDGTEFLVAWTDERNREFVRDFRGDIYAARVDLSGSVLDTGAFSVLREFEPEREPALVGLGGGRALVAVARFNQDAAFGNYRVALRTIDTTAAGGQVAPVTGLELPARDRLRWNPAAGAAAYDILRGDLGLLRETGSINDSSCRPDDLPNLFWNDGLTPEPGTGFYYVIRGDDAAVPPGTYDNAGPADGTPEGRDGEVDPVRDCSG